MQNSVVFYKLPFVYGGVTQPYFASDADRDLFLEDNEGQLVLDNVNIYLQFNYRCDLVVAVDYTAIVGYNFAKIKYNGKNYYANILDIEMVSVNKSRCKCIRNALFERTNFLQYFTNLKISKATFNDLHFSKNARYIPDFAFQRYKFKQDIELNNGDVYIVPFAVLYLGQILNAQDEDNELLNPYYSCGYVTSNYAILLKPIAMEGLPVDYLQDDSGKHTGLYYVDEGYIVDEDGNTDEHHLGWADEFKSIANYIALNSPYMGNLEILGIPCKTVELDGKNCVKPLFECEYKKLVTSQYNATGMFYIKEGDEIYYEFSSTNVNDLFIENTYYLGSVENALKIRNVDYDNGNQIYYKITFKYCFSIVGTDIVTTVTGFDGSVKGSTDDVSIFKLNANTSYAVDEKGLVNAQNKYFNALVENAVDKNNVSGMWNLLNNVGNIVGSRDVRQGIGGAIGAAAQVGNTLTDNYYYGQERYLTLKQSEEAPSSFKSGTNSASNAVQFDFKFWVEYAIPFENNLQEYLNEAHNYGISCYTTEDEFDFTLHSENKFFAVSAIGTLKYPTVLTQIEYTQLYNILKSGFRFKIFDEITPLAIVG